MSHSNSDGTVSGEAVYLFCLARAGLVLPPGRTGVDGNSPLIAYTVGNVVAITCTVSLAEFCGPSAEEHLEEMAWVGPRACRHHEVIAEVMRCSPVLPARFGTLFSSLDSLRALVTAHHDPICAFLDHVSDKEEWAVNGLLDRTAARAGLRSALQEDVGNAPDACSPGARYLQEQRLRLAIERELGSWLRDSCSEIASALGRHASDFRERSVRHTALTEGNARSVMNWAFLVPRAGAVAFRTQFEREKVERAARGLLLHLSGPWPPYSFCPSLSQEPSP